MIETGIKIKEYIFEEESSDVIVVKNKVYFDSYTQEQYQEFLDQLIEDGEMLNATFEENNWCLIGEFGTKHNVSFPFEINPQINKLLKQYVLFKLKIQYSVPSNVQKVASYAVDLLIQTNFLNLDKLVDFRNAMQDWTDTEKRASTSMREFLRFTKLENSQEFLSALHSISIPGTGNRELPSYKSIMVFDYIINDFILNGSKDLKLKYYPILIWWQLTKIVPLRPIELSLLQKDWLYQKNGSYFVKIERRKNKNRKVKYSTIPALTEFEIPENLYYLIEYYIELGRAFDDSKYILNYSFIRNNLGRGDAPKRKLNKEFCANWVLCELRDLFFEEVVCEQYGYKVVPKQEEEINPSSNEIELIQMGDTRHIAVCSMMLQGMNELTIAQIAGHRTLTEQMGYCNHLDSYTKAYTYGMAKSFQNKIKINSDELEITKSAKSQLIARSLIGNRLDKAMKVEHGYCLSKNFPFECEIDDCLFCPHFVGDGDISKSMLNQKKEMLDREINTKLNYIKAVVSNKGDFKRDNEAKTNAKSLSSSLNRKAIIEAYMMK